MCLNNAKMLPILQSCYNLFTKIYTFEPKRVDPIGEIDIFFKFFTVKLFRAISLQTGRGQIRPQPSSLGLNV